MSRDYDHRGPRRRGFDDDNFYDPDHNLVEFWVPHA